MYNIAICDDQIICAQTLEISVRNIMSKFNIPFNIDIYTSGNKLLNNIKEENIYDILFLDIIMGEDDLNGMELARDIRKFNETITIVFVTSSIDFTLEGYSVRALQYLLKPVNEDILYNIFEFEIKNLDIDYIFFKEKEANRKVRIDSIIHVETYGRNVRVVLDDDEFLALNKISDIEKMLPEGNFVRCHQSYIININFIKELHHFEAITTKESLIPISRAQWNITKKMFLSK